MRRWKRNQPGQYVTAGYTVIKFDRDNLWHVFDTTIGAEVTLRGLRTLREAKALVEDFKSAYRERCPLDNSPKIELES